MANGLPQPIAEEEPFGVSSAPLLPPGDALFDQPDIGLPAPIDVLGLQQAPVGLPPADISADRQDAGLPPLSDMAAQQPAQDFGLPPIELPSAIQTIGLPPDEEFAGDSVTPLSRLAERSQVVRDKSDAVDTQRAELETLGLERGRLVRALPLAKEGQRKKLVGKIGEVERGMASGQEDLATARDEAEEEKVIQEAELGIQSSRARQSAITNAQAEIDRQRAVADANLTKLRDQEAEAVVERDEAVASNQRLLTAGPSRSVGILLADILGEALNARLDNRTPNFNASLARHRSTTDRVFAQQRTATMSKVKISGDRISDLAAQRRVLKADGLERDAAIMNAALQQAERGIAIAQTDADEASAIGLRDQLVQARDEKMAQAAVARQEAITRAQERDLDLQIKQATLGEKLSKAAKTRAEVAKLERRGRGAGPAPVPVGLIKPNVVSIPGLDRPLVTFPDTKEGRKKAAVTRDIVGDQQRLLNVMNGLQAEFEDLEKQGLLGSIGVKGSKANEAFESKRLIALARLAQIKAGPGKAAVADDEVWAAKFLPDNPNAWSSKARGTRQLEAARNVFEDEVRTVLQRTTELDTATRESVVKRASAFRVSRKQRARELGARAGELALDKSKSVGVRVKAVELVEENARAEAKESGTDWVLPAVAQTAQIVIDTDDPEVEDKAFEQLEKYERFIESRIKRATSIPGGVATAEAVAPQLVRDVREARERIKAAKLEIAKKKVKQLGDTAAAKAILQFLSPDE